MALTKDSVLDALKDAGIPFDLHEHEEVLTVDAQVRKGAV